MLKKTFSFIIFAIIFAPCLLIANESDNLWVNLAGVIYILILFLVGKTKSGKRAFKMLENAIGIKYNNNEEDYYE